MKRARQYLVEVDWYGETVEHVETARSRSAARYAKFCEVSDPFPDLTFGEFQKLVKSVRVTACRTSYDYIRESYGVEVEVGQRVETCSGSGVVAEPNGSNPRASYVQVIIDGRAHPSNFHPMDLR